MDLSFVYRKISESRSSSMKSGHMDKGDRIGVVSSYCNRLGSAGIPAPGQPVPGPPLLIISHSQQWKMS